MLDYDSWSLFRIFAAKSYFLYCRGIGTPLSLDDCTMNKSRGFFSRILVDCTMNKSKGEIGDWINYFSPSMIEKLSKIIEEKLGESGLSFKANF